MDIYISGNLPKSDTDKGTSVKLQLPALPQEIEINKASQFATYNIIGLGPVQVPNGEELTEYKWEGILPGAGRKNEPWVKSWNNPETIINYFDTWKKYKVKLKLTISEMNINNYVYLKSVESKRSGSYGDYTYVIYFVEAKDVSVTVTYKKTSTSTSSSKATTRQSKTKEKTYTVKKGDCLWNIAKKYYGKGSQWKKIYKKNKSVIEKSAKKHGKKSSSNGHWIYPGTKLVIP